MNSAFGYYVTHARGMEQPIAVSAAPKNGNVMTAPAKQTQGSAHSLAVKQYIPCRHHLAIRDPVKTPVRPPKHVIKPKCVEILKRCRLYMKVRVRTWPFRSPARWSSHAAYPMRAEQESAPT